MPPMKSKRRQLPAIVWQLSLMVGLGIPGLFFMPILLRQLDHQVMASILISQVYVYYLIILVNFGLDWSSPAEYGQAVNEDDAHWVWIRSLRSKISIMVFVAIPLFFLGYALSGSGGIYLLVLLGLLFATAFNSNWILNAKENFNTGVAYVYGGVALSLSLVFVLTNINKDMGSVVGGVIAVLIMIFPQLTLGVGSWLSARKESVKKGFFTADGKIFDFSTLKANYLLVFTQLMQLMTATLGTLVVGAFADALTVTAYGALEKIFNLAVSVLVSFYMVRYPRYAAIFQNDRRQYWRNVGFVFGANFAAGILVLVALSFFGQKIGGLYLTDALTERVLSVLLPFSVWLSICIGQNLLTGYYIFSKNIKMAFMVNLAILSVTCSVGYASVIGLEPVMWVLGLIAGQVFALVWLASLFYVDRRFFAS